MYFTHNYFTDLQANNNNNNNNNNNIIQFLFNNQLSQQAV